MKNVNKNIKGNFSISKKEIEQLSINYAKEMESCYMNDYAGFMAGMYKAFEIQGIEVKET